METTPTNEPQSSSSRSRQRASQNGGQGQQIAPQTGDRGRQAVPARMYQDPFSAMWQLSREMDRLMESFFGRAGSLLGRMGASMLEPPNVLWTPRVDVRQRGDSLLICADLPGVKREDVHVEVADGGGGLAIHGERREEYEEGSQQEGYRHAERFYGRFYRTIPLPEGARVDEAKATMREGVLEVTVPLEKGQGRRQIQIESA